MIVKEVGVGGVAVGYVPGAVNVREFVAVERTVH